MTILGKIYYNMQTNWIIKLRIILWLILIVTVIWLLDRAIVPGGKISYVYDFKKDSKFIYNLTPGERVQTEDGLSNKIVGDPVYFSLRTPRGFDMAKLTLTYQNLSDQPIIEAGVLADKTVWRYDLKPMDNKIMDQLMTVWPVIYGINGVMLIQREEKYQTVDDFLKNLPDPTQIATYNYNLKTKFSLPNYKAGGQENKIDYPLRGAYQFYTYIKDEALDYRFAFTDLNHNTDGDPIEVNLYYDGGLIASQHQDDNFPGGDSGIAVDRWQIALNEPNLPEGVYRVEVHVNDDIVTDQIITKQSKLAFINKIWVAGNAENINLVTDSQAVTAQTQNPASLQTVKIGDKDLHLAETYKQYGVTSDKNITDIDLAKADVVLAGDGVFSFDQDELIDPAFKKVDQNFNLKQTRINYIIANYQPPQWQNQWQVSQAQFDLTKAYTEFGKYTFLISVPGLEADDNVPDSVIIKKIRVDLQGKSLWQKLKEIISHKP